MPKTLLFCLLLCFSMPMLQGQHIHLGEPIPGISPCELPLGNSKEKISKPYQFKRPPNQRELIFNINYLPDGSTLNGNTCSTWPTAAMTAFTYAMTIWSDVLENDQNIGVNACWTSDLAAGTLGSAGPTQFYILDLATLPGVTLFPAALSEHLANQSLETVDISASFNADRTDWYFGTDAMPGSNIDFVTVVLHELGHGLGFLGGSDLDDGIVDVPAGNIEECKGVDGTGCYGLKVIQTTDGVMDTFFLPTIYDRFVDLADASRLTDQVNPSVAVRDLLIGGNGSLEFDEENHQVRSLNHALTIHTPITYSNGSSYSHFSETTYPNELMSPSVSAGQAIHEVGLAFTVMAEMGWSQAIVPVELSLFSGRLEDQFISLEWETQSEINNDYFEIQRSADGKIFQPIGKVNGNGTVSTENTYSFIDRKPFIGANYYRLKQIDYDGRAEFSHTVLVQNRADSGITISPNPVQDVLILDFVPKTRRQVEIFSLDGRRMYDGLLKERIDVSHLPKGSYFLRISGNDLSFQKFIKA